MDLRQNKIFKSRWFRLVMALVIVWYCGYVFLKVEEGRNKQIIGWIDDYKVDRGVVPNTLADLGDKNFRGRNPHYHRVDSRRYVLYYKTGFDNIIAWHSWRGKWEKKLYLTPLDSTLIEQIRATSSQLYPEKILAVSFADSLRISYFGVNSDHFRDSIFRGFINYDTLKVAIYDENKVWENKLYNPNFFEKEGVYNWPKSQSDSLLINTYSLSSVSANLR